MNLKTATLIALIGITIETLLILLLHMNILYWQPTYNLLALIIGKCSLMLFLSILYSKQK